MDKIDINIGMHELNLFPSPLRYIILNNVDNNSIIEYCYNYQKNNPSREVSNKGGYQSHNLSGPIPELNDIFKSVLHYTNIEFSKYGKTELFYPTITNAWININPKNSYNVTHDHPGCYYSFVYYAKVPKNSGNINFYHPSLTMPHVWNQKDFVDVSSGKYTNLEYEGLTNVWKEPVEKLLIWFPSWLKHSVDMNYQDEPRISVAINTFIEKI